MKKTKLIAMMMTGALLVPMTRLGQTIYAKEAAQASTTSVATDNNQYASVKSNAKLVDANGKEIAKVTSGDMAVIVNNKDGKTLIRLQKTGTEGYLEESSIIQIKDADANKVEAMDKSGAIKNVDTVVNVRALPSMNSIIKTVLTNGTGIKILGKTGDWFKVTVGSNSGFIFGNYVEEGATGKVVTAPVEKATVEHKDVVSSPNKGGNVVKPATTPKSTAKAEDKAVSNTSNTKVEKPSNETKEEAKTGVKPAKPNETKPSEKPSNENKEEVKPSTPNETKPTDNKEEVKPSEKPSNNNEGNKEEVKPSEKPVENKDEVKPSNNEEATKPSSENKEEVKPSTPKDEAKPVKPVKPSNNGKEDNKPVKPSNNGKEDNKPTGNKDEVKPVKPSNNGKDEAKPVKPVKPSNNGKEDNKPTGNKDEAKPVKPVKPVEVHKYNVPSISPNAGDCLMDILLTPELNSMYGKGFYGNYNGQAISTMGGVYTRLLSGQMSLDQAKSKLVGKYVEDGYKITDIKMINFVVPQDEWAVYGDPSDYILNKGGMQKFSAAKQKDFFTMWNHNGQNKYYFTRVVFLMNK